MDVARIRWSRQAIERGWLARRAIGIAAVALVAMLSGATSGAAESPPAAGEASVREAISALRSSDEAAAVPILELNALAGDSRAQFLLGVAYFTGNALPVNKPLGFAWLQLAADSTDRNSGWSSRKAVDVMTEVQPKMSAQDLLEADRLVPTLIDQMRHALDKELRPALDFYSKAPAEFTDGKVRFVEPMVQISVPTGPSSDPLVMQGCAAVEQMYCPAEAAGGAADCTGRIVHSETASSANGGVAKIVQPVYPVGARRYGGVGRVKVLMHVAASGWVCSVTLAGSSGDPGLDRAAVTATRRWRVNPAQAAGQPVESLLAVAAEFALN